MAEIKLLKEVPHYAVVLAYWSYNLWYRKREIDFNTVVKAYEQRIEDGSLPVSWVAVDETMPVGMVSLKENDLWTRKDLNPWLASLYVEPEFRRQGTAEKLIQAVLAKSSAMGYSIIYLFLGSNDARLENYYLNLGWKYLEDAVDNDGHPTKILSYVLK